MRGAQLTRNNPPHAQDYPVLDRMERIGITLGRRLDLRAISPEARLAWKRQRRFADNALHRHALRFGRGQASLPTASDGSTTLYVQRESPLPTREANWLPAPRSGPFSLSLRLYWPKASVITGAWFPPPVRAADGGHRPAPN